MRTYTAAEREAAVNALYDRAWLDEDKRFRPKREIWVPRVLGGEFAALSTGNTITLQCELTHYKTQAGLYRLMLALADTTVPIDFRRDLEDQPTVRASEYIEHQAKGLTKARELIARAHPFLYCDSECGCKGRDVYDAIAAWLLAHPAEKDCAEAVQP